MTQGASAPFLAMTKEDLALYASAVVGIVVVLLDVWVWR